MKSPKDWSLEPSVEACSRSFAQTYLGQETTKREASEHDPQDFLGDKSAPLAEAAKLAIPWSSTTEMTLPEQFFRAANQSFAVWTGERRLLLAVLEEAVESFFRYRNAATRRRQRLFHETVEWFWSHDQGWLYSFETICQHLNLDAEYIRSGLERLYEMGTDEETTTLSVHSKKRRRQANRPFAHAA